MFVFKVTHEVVIVWVIIIGMLSVLCYFVTVYVAVEVAIEVTIGIAI